VDRLQIPEGGAIVTYLDVTERHLAERHAEETRRQMAHMGRVALVGELSAAMSHDLRQPLAAIRANAQAGALLVARTPTDSSEVARIFNDIVAEDTHAVEVIEGVRRLLRKGEPVASTVDLNEICHDAVRVLHHDAVVRDTRLELSLSSAPLMVHGDPVELRQLVLNLALNGLEAASSSPVERVVVVRTESHADHIEMIVHDSGPGISPHAQTHLFESFFSTKTNGLGLGLSIVQSIVQRHNGRITVENHSRGGAEFRVSLPMAPG
jgi:C4-dicarboxylate-specific signal transduction histidine kinase